MATMAEIPACRNDGDINTPIHLHPYQHERRGCQKVQGMNSIKVVILWDDDGCGGGPFNVGNSNNHHALTHHHDSVSQMNYDPIII